MYHWKCLVNIYNNDAGYTVAQDKDYEAHLYGTKLVAHMEDLWKEDFTSIQINRPHNVVQKSA